MSLDSFSEKCQKLINGITIGGVILFCAVVGTMIFDKDTRQEIADDYKKSHPEAAAKAKYEETKEEGAQMSEEDFKNSCTNINSNTSYKNLLRNPDSYKGDKVFVDLKIENTNLGVSDLSVNYENNTVSGATCSDPALNLWFGDRYVFCDNRKAGPKLLPGDIVRVYGYFYETELFDTTGENTVEAPVLEVRYIDFYGN